MPLLTYPLILADVAPDAGYTRNFSTCFKISNLNKYPNHLLFARVGSEISAKPSGNYVQIQTDRCISISGYYVAANIVAIDKKHVKSTDLKQTSTGLIFQNSQIQKRLIKGKPIVRAPAYVPIINEGKQIEIIYKIQSIDRQGLKLVAVGSSPAQILNTLLFPAIGMTILGWIIWQRKRNIVGRKVQ